MSVKRAIMMTLVLLALASLPLQIAIDSSAENVASTCIIMASSFSLLLYISWTRALETQPLSTFSLFGFCLTTQLGALLVQTVAWTAVRSSLYDSLYTFGSLAFYQAIALMTHVAYRYFSAPRTAGTGILRSLMTWVGIYRVPSSASLWFMGCAGLVAVFFARYENILGKLANAFTFLTWAPFLMPFYMRQLGDTYCNARLNNMLLIAYALGVAVLGVGLNTRGIMFTGVVTVALLYVLAGLRSDSPVTGRALLRLGVLACILVVLSGPLSDLATSMVIARASRGKVSASEMIRTTIRVFRNQNLLDAYRAGGAAASRYKAYDEHYLNNPLLSRLIETKFHDNAFHFARAIKSEDANKRLRDVSIQFAWAGLPTPFLNGLGIKVVKDNLGYSMGDYLAYLSRGIPLGGRKIGSMFAQGVALFGPFFPFVYSLLCVGLFGLMDLLTFRPREGVATITALGMLEILGFFLGGISYEALHHVLYLFLRNFEQMVIAYVFVFGLSRFFLGSEKSFKGSVVAAVWQHSA